MSAHPLLPDPTCLTLERIRIEDGVIIFAARTVAKQVSCPCCGHSSERVHSRYQRTLLDLPWQGNAVRVVLTVRRFFCDNYSCEWRIFAERLPQVAEHYSRKTCRLAEALRELAFLAGGEAAARIARTFGLLVSPDALLHNLRRSPQKHASTPRVLGVDDFAIRRGHRYGTILVDMEKHRPVDLLPDRDSTTLSNWLNEHPGVQVVSRDRADAYRNGITTGAPEAAQIADRWHLLKNIGEALERQISAYSRELKEIARQVEKNRTSMPEAQHLEPERHQSARNAAQQQRRREQRLQAFEQVWELRRKGWTERAISEQTGVSVRTIQRFLRAEDFPERSPRSAQPRRTDAFASYLRCRLDEGCRNAAQLFREMRERGYQGSYSGVYAAVRELCAVMPAVRPNEKQWSRGRSPTLPRSCVLSNRSVAWWLRGYYSAEPEAETFQRSMVELLCQRVPVLKEAADLVNQFGQIVTRRQITELDAWLHSALHSASKEMRLFARGLQQDWAAVQNAVTLEWSNGQTEGQVNRLKFLKRQMYGRASFDLLRARVLHQPLS